MATRNTSRKGIAGDQPVDFGPLPGFIGYHVRLAQIAVFKDFIASLGQFKISPIQFGALIVIEANPGILQSQLARAIQLDRSTVVPLIDRLEKRKLVAREGLAGDRRVNALNLTAAGKRLLEKLKPRVAEHEQRLTRRLGKRQQAQLIELLGKLIPAPEGS